MNVVLTRDKSFYSSLVRLAIPVALQNLITFAVTFADNLNWMKNLTRDRAI